MANRRAILLRHKTGTPMVGAEGLFKSCGIDIDSAITERFKLQAVAVELLETLAKFERIPVTPMQKYVHADQFFVRPIVDSKRSLCRFFRSFGIRSRLKLFGFLSEPGDNCVRKFFGSYFLFAGSSFIDIVRMHTVLKCAKPSIVNQLSYVGLAYVDQHQDPTVKKARWVCQVLSSSTWSRTVNGLEHGALIPDIGGTG